MNNKKIWLSILLILLLGTFYLISFFVDDNNIQAEEIIEKVEVEEESVSVVKVILKERLKHREYMKS